MLISLNTSVYGIYNYKTTPIINGWSCMSVCVCVREGGGGGGGGGADGGLEVEMRVWEKNSSGA